MNSDTTITQDFISALDLSISDQQSLQDVFKIFTHALELHSLDSDAYMRLGVSLYDRCYPDAAIIAYNYAISLSPHCAATFNYLGDALCEVNRYDDAVDAYKAAIKLDKLLSLTTVYTDLAFALYSCAKLSEALDEVEKGTTA